MPFSIVSVGFDFPGGVVETIRLGSRRSLLDTDIVVFKPGIPWSGSSYQSYLGKPKLTEHESFAAREAISHWQSEIKAAVEAGKLVLVYLAAPVEVFVDTGERTYSGTGRNARVTNIVTPLRSYEAIPFEIKVTAASGQMTKLAAESSNLLAAYWSEFGNDSPYEVFLDGKFTQVLLTTRSADRTLGAVVRAGKGALVFLPRSSWIGTLSSLHRAAMVTMTAGMVPTPR